MSIEHYDAPGYNSNNRECVRLYPTACRFVTGVASSYDDTFPAEVEGIVARADFEAAINQINNTLTDYWPCFFCVGCGYAFCVCSAGLSLLCPSFCISDAENYTRALIKRINNRPCFQKSQVEWELVKKCGSSWIELSFPEHATGKLGRQEPSSGYQSSSYFAAPLSSASITPLVYGSETNSMAARTDIV